DFHVTGVQTCALPIYTPGDHRPDVPVAQPVGPDCLDDGLLHRLGGHGDLKPNGPGRTVEPVHMLPKLEDAAVVQPDPLKDAVAVEKTVVEDGDLRLLPGDQLAVEVDLHAHPSSSKGEVTGHRRACGRPSSLVARCSSTVRGRARLSLSPSPAFLGRGPVGPQGVRGEPVHLTVLVHGLD